MSDITVTLSPSVAMQMQAALATRSARLVDILDLAETPLDTTELAIIRDGLRDTINGLATIVKALYPDDASIEVEWDKAQRAMDRLKAADDLSTLADGDHHVGLGHLPSSRYRSLDQVAVGTGIDLSKQTFEGGPF